jgi:hypothetical protein
MTTKMTLNRLCRIIPLLGGALCLLWVGTGTVFADDDFSNIVRHIESRYHAHRNLRFLMGFAGVAAKFWPGTGVRGVKIALFEDQQVFRPGPDVEVEDLMRSLGDSGWQPMVKSVSQRGIQRTYIYAKPLGKDFRVLVVDVESTEAVVVEAKMDSSKLEELINDHSANKRRRHRDQSQARVLD